MSKTSKPDNFTTSYQVNFGKRILPIKRVETFSSEDWEEFIEEWLDLKKDDCFDIERFGGAGDKGRDVAFYITDNSNQTYTWDCYQCKHYDNSLMPTQVYVEFGKIIYYSFTNHYPVPRKYFFIAPKGCGTSLTQLLQNPKSLKLALKENWERYCKAQITNIPIELSGKFLEYFESFDFTIFSKKHIKEIIEEHKKHPNHITRFGGGLPERERVDTNNIPKNIQDSEIIYVNQLLKAYSTESETKFNKHEELIESESKYLGHFVRARIGFHHAEQLRNFSRDSLPPNTYLDFQDEILNSIIDIVEEEHKNAFVKVKEAEKQSRSVVISSNPLKDVSIIHDRVGVCHQLVNDEKIKWVKNEE